MPDFTNHLSDEDALMWNIEKDPELRSTIVAAAILDAAPEWDRLVARVRHATLLIPRMRQRVLSPPFRLGPPRWAVDPNFDLHFHLRRARLPEPGDRRTLLDLIEPIAMASFDRARPLWELHLVEGLDGDGAAIVLKIHHAVTDGVGGIQLAAHLVDFSRDGDRDRRATSSDRPAGERFNALQLVGDSLQHVGRRWRGIAGRVPGSTIRLTGAVLRDPTGTTRAATDTARSVVKLLKPANTPMSPVMGRRSLGRRLDTMEFAVDDLKRAAKHTDGTLNDAFVAAVLGGLWHYHDHHGAPVAQLRMTMPINLRTAKDAGTAGNHFTPVRFPVPLTLADPVERMQRIRELVTLERAEPAIELTGVLASILNRLPTATTTAIFGSMLKGADFVATNVPGAPMPIYVCGSEVLGFFAFAPPGGAGANVALMSHCDRCCIGVVTDTAAVPDPDVFVASLRRGFDEVIALG